MRKGIIQWSPFNEMDNFFDEDFDNGFDFTPPVDVYQEGDNVVVKTPIADIDKDDIDISIEDNVLTVSGKTSSEEEVKKEDYYRKEVREGSFSRSVSLPTMVKEDEAKATYKKGVLKIVVPKVEEVKSKRVSIEMED